MENTEFGTKNLSTKTSSKALKVASGVMVRKPVKAVVVVVHFCSSAVFIFYVTFHGNDISNTNNKY